MTTTFYDCTVACFLQTLGGVAGFLDKGLAHFAAHKVDPEEIVDTRLIPDMLPFRFQVIAVAHHSLGAIEAGTFILENLPVKTLQVAATGLHMRVVALPANTSIQGRRLRKPSIALYAGQGVDRPTPSPTADLS